MVVIHIVDGRFWGIARGCRHAICRTTLNILSCVDICENKEDNLMEFESRWGFVRVWLKLLF